jgi:hypothetical protein
MLEHPFGFIFDLAAGDSPKIESHHTELGSESGMKPLNSNATFHVPRTLISVYPSSTNVLVGAGGDICAVSTGRVRNIVLRF